jgi:hypothetical protein
MTAVQFFNWIGCGRMTEKPEVISSPVGLVPRNALVLTEPINSRTTRRLYRNGHLGSVGRIASDSHVLCVIAATN